MALPVTVGDGGVQGDLPLDLIRVEVARRAPVLDTPQTGHGTSGEQQRLYERRLADAPVPDDADVPNLADLDGHPETTLPDI